MILPADASYTEFCDYIVGQRGPLSDDELQSMWEFRQKTLSLTVVTGRGYRSQLPPDEQHMTLKEREQKVLSEARAAGKDPVYVGRRWV